MYPLTPALTKHSDASERLVLILFRLPMAIFAFAKRPLLIAFANSGVLCVVVGRSYVGDLDDSVFAISVEVTASVVVIMLTIVLHAALWRIAAQAVRSTKATTELNAASALLELMCDAVVELDENLRILSFSPHLASMLLRRSSTLEGARFIDFIPTDQGKDHATQYLGGYQSEMEIQMRAEPSSKRGSKVSAKAFHTYLVDSCSSKFRTEAPQTRFGRWTCFNFLLHRPA